MEAGATKGEEFAIVENDNQNIVAIANLGSLGPNYSVFVFNKKNNHAVWTKATNSFWMGGSAEYLTCI